MKYYSTIISLFILNLLSVVLLLYFANITRNFEKENFSINKNIKFLKDQININEIEYSLHNRYEYLKKMQKIYFEEVDEIYVNNRLSFYDFKNRNIKNLYNAGIK